MRLPRSRTWLLPVFLLASCHGERPRHGGADLHVLFDERHGLDGGEPVRLHDFDVGEVTSVDLAESRVRANLSIDPDVLAQLTRETTVSVEGSGSERFLLIHVLDPEAEKIPEGDTLEGVDSGIELTVRQAATGASRVMERIGVSEWMEHAQQLLSDLERQIDDADLGKQKEELRRQLDGAKKELDRAAGETAEQAKKSLAAARDELKRAADELDKLGRSEDAKKLREWIETLGEDRGGSRTK